MRLGKDLSGLRDQNLSVLLSTVWEKSPISRIELAEQTGLAPSSITRLIRLLKNHGLIIEAGKGESSGGRQPLLLSPNPGAGLIMSLDLSGSTLRGGIINAANKLMLLQEQPLEGLGAENIKNQILELSRKLYSHPEVVGKTFLGIGVSAPGTVQSGQTITESFPLMIQNFPLHQILADEFHLPVYLESDTSAAALAEKYYGVGMGEDDFLYVLVSAGIGGSAIIGGQLYQGRAGFAGYMGHLMVNQCGPICQCGKRGCLEQLAAAPAILGGIEHALSTGRGDAVITKMVDSNLVKLSLEIVAEAAHAGSILAIEAFENSADHLAFAIINMATVLDISTFIIGGEVPHYAGDLYFQAIRKSIKRFSNLDEHFKNVNIVPAKLERESFLRGISMLTIQDIFGIQY
jgi:N-acetylglucosamine repressor